MVCIGEGRSDERALFSYPASRMKLPLAVTWYNGRWNALGSCLRPRNSADDVPNAKDAPRNIAYKRIGCCFRARGARGEGVNDRVKVMCSDVNLEFMSAALPFT